MTVFALFGATGDLVRRMVRGLELAGGQEA